MLSDLEYDIAIRALGVWHAWLSATDGKIDVGKKFRYALNEAQALRIVALDVEPVECRKRDGAIWRIVFFAR